jgi:hypothetical protein
MPRNLKPMKVDYVHDSKTEQYVDVMLDRNSNDFFAKVGEETVRDATAAGCKEKARKLLISLRDFKWTPYIWVQVKEERESGFYGTRAGRGADRITVKLEFEFSRGELAARPDGKFVTRHYLDEKGLSDSDYRLHGNAPEYLAGDAEHNRSVRSRGEDICNYWPEHDQENVRLDYNEATWLALNAVKERIEQAKKQLQDVVKSADFEKKLILVAANLKFLPEGKKK